MSLLDSRSDIRYLKDAQGTTTDVVIPITLWQTVLQSSPTVLGQSPGSEISPAHLLNWFQVVLELAQQQSDPDLIRTILTQLLENEGIAELIEDIALSEAIATGEQTETVPESDVFALLDV